MKKLSLLMAALFMLLLPGFAAAAETGSRESFKEQGANFMKSANAGNYAANRQAPVQDLDGQTLSLKVRDTNIVIKHTFAAGRVTWSIKNGPANGDGAVVPYEAFKMADGIYFVAFQARPDEGVAWVANLNTGAATLVQGNLVNYRPVSKVMDASIEEVAKGKKVAWNTPHSLAGSRFFVVYDDNKIAYEHIYLTDHYDTWMSVYGPQRGQADTEEYQSVKVADGIYFLYWNEKVLATQMVFLFNFNEPGSRCVGQVFGVVGDGSNTIVCNTIGAYVKMIHTLIPELPARYRLDVWDGKY